MRRVFGSLSLVLGLGSLVACGDDETATGGGGSGGGGGAPPACDVEKRAEDEAQAPAIHTPRWAFRPWISKDISTGEDTRSFVDGFHERDIPVGVVVLDSPWETNYNTFVPNPERYPDFGEMVADLRAEDIRVVLWTTQMINVSSYDLEPTGDVYMGPSPDYEPAAACGYFVNENRTFAWWKGTGSAVDFFNPDARAFWHRLQDPLFDMGVSGFKLDFGESYVDELPIRSAEGEKTLQEYSEAYYEDFYRYGSARAPADEFVTMVRPYDKSYQFEGRFFARPEHAPVAWVGDNRRDYIGMEDALDHIFRSAEAGYVVVGSDLGGYLDRDDKDLTQDIPLDAGVFMRWTALSSMTPFMQLHGRANLEPWTFPEEPELVTDTYRYWAKLHDELVPFFDSVAIAQYDGGDVRMIRPVATETQWPDDWRYWLGDALLVVPVTDDTGVVDIEIPNDARYFALFDPAGTPIEPGTVLAGYDVSDPSRIPVFAREGAIIPMEIADAVTGFGTTASAGALTVLVYPAEEGLPFEVLDNDDALELSVSATTTPNGASLLLSAHPRTVILRVRIDAAPTAVEGEAGAIEQHASRESFDAAERGWFAEGGFVWIKLTPADSGIVSVE
ncbi:MAG: hypothetical protein HOW73_12750 [Polyangiaceae bacterium]|nr:hypothetical protein [Polyangiaceae bacterium]